MGRKKRPFYRIVVMDSKARRDGATIENIGYYNPVVEPADIRIDEDRALDWLKKGAIPTDTVKSILKKAGVMNKFYEQKAAK